MTRHTQLRRQVQVGRDLLLFAAVSLAYAAGSLLAYTGFGASDAHENALPWPLADGERGDAYERMIP